MNMLASAPARLAVEIVFDFVCPWCYLGVHRLGRVLAARVDIIPELAWRPFLLNPDMPRLGMARSDYMIRKFGAEDRARRLYASIAEIGQAEGLAFDFAAIRRTPSSVDAHRLVRFATPRGGADRLVPAIFRAHFADGMDIGDPEILAGLGAAAGLDPDAIHNFLTSSEGVEQVHAENLHAHRLGINGVPCFLIEGEHAIAGAQEPEVLERLFDLAASVARPV